MHSKRYYVYILTNLSNTVLYIGVTSNLSRRLDEHKNKDDPDSFTAKYNINKIVYLEIYDDPYSAITREKQLKSSSRLRKVEFIHSVNPNWDELIVY